MLKGVSEDELKRDLANQITKGKLCVSDELEETKPGFYELSIPLPTGIYYYNYYLGMNSFVDKTNPNRAYTPEGRTASVIKVN